MAFVLQLLQPRSGSSVNKQCFWSLRLYKNDCYFVHHHTVTSTIRLQVKLGPVRDWRSTPTYCQLQSHVTQKLGQKSKIRPR